MLKKLKIASVEQLVYEHEFRVLPRSLVSQFFEAILTFPFKQLMMLLELLFALPMICLLQRGQNQKELQKWVHL